LSVDGSAVMPDSVLTQTIERIEPCNLNKPLAGSVYLVPNTLLDRATFSLGRPCPLGPSLLTRDSCFDACKRWVADSDVSSITESRNSTCLWYEVLAIRSVGCAVLDQAAGSWVSVGSIRARRFLSMRVQALLGIECLEGRRAVWPRGVDGFI
jgi:hypothetical protein